jgi:hypothetical protein
MKSRFFMGEQRTRRLHLLRAQRNIDRVLEHQLLSLFAQNEAQELFDRRIQGLLRRLVGVEVDEAAQG